MEGGSLPGAGRLVALVLLSCLALAGWVSAAAGDPPSADERQELVRLTERFLQAVASGDSEYLGSSLYPEARFVYIEQGADGAVISSSSTARLLEAAPQWESRVQERIRDPRVLIDGRMGLVWARYQYRMDDRVSHCGTDLFTFMKTDEGWLLASGSWTVEHEGCERGTGPQP